MAEWRTVEKEPRVAHDWANDWMKPGVEVTFDDGGEQRTGVVRVVSYNAKDAIVAWEVDGKTVERMMSRGQLRAVAKG